MKFLFIPKFPFTTEMKLYNHFNLNLRVASQVAEQLKRILGNEENLGKSQNCVQPSAQSPFQK